MTLPPKNHNNPPSEMDMLKETLELRHLIVLKQADEQIAFVTRVPAQIFQDNEANYVADYIKRMKECVRLLERERKTEKEEFLRKGQFVDAFFKETTVKLDNAIIRANAPLNDYLQRKAAAEKAERDETARQMRQMQEDAILAATKIQGAPLHEAIEVMQHATTMSNVVASADQQAAAPVVSMAKAAGAYSKATMVEKWVGTITDYALLDLNKLRAHISPVALQTALNAFVKVGGRDCAGTKIKPIIETVVK